MPPELQEEADDKECFTLEEVQKAITNMHNGKACNMSGIYAEMLKWMHPEGLAYINNILYHAYRNSFPLDCKENCIKALHKGGDKQELRNYRTIMIGPIMAKLFGSILEKQMSTWAENNAKRAKGQQSFEQNTTQLII